MNNKKDLAVALESGGQTLNDVIKPMFVDEPTLKEKLKAQDKDSKRMLNNQLQNHYSTEFKKNMLLSFYDWPKVETSAVLTSSL